ncbi:MULTISPECIES: phosphoserine phosphatase SerB [Kocuria]|mgnify:CR=1 FL=1|uniref:phosphoserine phosphatase SerB n=1 Tax=Kocuria TaxID=57493 RepID=UPI00069FB6D8|nr:MULTISPECIES: phosphoserine phosphatase SerB [Kocuria]MCT1366848.1 phosphoserine phosphatase SerB [Rothia sp. p3-SID1597]
MSKNLRIVALRVGAPADRHRDLYRYVEDAGAQILNGIDYSVPALPEVRADGRRAAQRGGPQYSVVTLDVRWPHDLAELRGTLRPDPLSRGLEGYDLNVVDPAILTADRRMLVMDADSTLLDGEVIDELAAVAGVRHEVAQVTEQAMRGDMDFSESFRRRVATLSGQHQAVMHRVSRSLVLNPGALQLVNAFHVSDNPVCVVSGGFITILKPVIRQLDIECARANDVTIKDDRLTGEVRGTIVDGQVKQDSVKEWAKKFGVKPSNVVAVGDGANDAMMLDRAGLGVAYNAKPVLRQVADAQINFPRLDAVRHLIGM